MGPGKIICMGPYGPKTAKVASLLNLCSFSFFFFFFIAIIPYSLLLCRQTLLELSYS